MCIDAYNNPVMDAAAPRSDSFLKLYMQIATCIQKLDIHRGLLICILTSRFQHLYDMITILLSVSSKQFFLTNWPIFLQMSISGLRVTRNLRFVIYLWLKFDVKFRLTFSICGHVWRAATIELSF